MFSLADRTTPGTWRPPVVKTVALHGSGAEQVLEALDKHRAHLDETGGLRRRRERRAAEEIEQLALERLRSRFETVGGRGGLGALAARLVAGDIDPYAAVDVLLEGADRR
jgi:LAO/AO transport system kinase